MYRFVYSLTLFFLTSNSFCQKFISPLQFEYTESSFNKIEAFINYDVNKSVELYERNDSLTIKTLRKYSWEAFYNLLIASDTLLIKQVSQQDFNILKYQSIWSSYYHIKTNGTTYTYGNTKSINHKYLVEGQIDDEDFFSY